MRTQQWCDTNRDGFTVLPIFRIEIYTQDPALWLEFQWLGLNTGIIIYFE